MHVYSFEIRLTQSYARYGSDTPKKENIKWQLRETEEFVP